MLDNRNYTFRIAPSSMEFGWSFLGMANQIERHHINFFNEIDQMSQNIVCIFSVWRKDDINDYREDVSGIDAVNQGWK